MRALLALSAAAGAAVHATASAGTPLYKDAAQPIPARVADLVSRMTVPELANQLINKNEGGWDQIPDILATYGTTSMGSLFIDEVMNKSAWGCFGLNCSAQWSTPLQALRARNALQAAFLNTSRLQIPVSFCMEGLHSGAWGGTMFPGPPVLAMAFNDSLVELIGQAIAVEARASGVDTALSPVTNMFSDPRFGRYSEGFTPDPLISAHMGAAMVLGLQGPPQPGGPASYLPSINTTVIAMAKHFAAYGAAAGGLNGGVAEVTNRSLWEIYLKPWRAMAAAGMRSCMISHQTVNDVPCHGSGWLINDVLRNTFGFGDGFTMSDEMNIGHLGPWGWGVADNISDAAAVALKAGVDIDLQSGGSNATQAYSWLQQALSEGLIAVSDLVRSASRVLTMKFAAGLFDAPFADEAQLPLLDSHRQLALEAARQGIVLAKNEGGVLPLNLAALPKQRLALIGPFLSCNFTEPAPSAALAAARKPLRDPTPDFCIGREALLGPYAQDNGQTPVALLPEALGALAPQGLQLTVSQGASVTAAADGDMIAAAVASAAAADVAVLVLGDSLQVCDEGIDRSSLDLTPAQLALLQAVAANTTTPIVLVLLNGRPMTFGPGLNAVLARVGALIIASRPGAMGSQALAEILTGAVSPSGKLADAWAQTVGQIRGGGQPFQALQNGEWASSTRLPRDPDGRVYPAYWDDDFAPSTPLFPLFWGQTYTTFNYTTVAVAQNTPLSALPPVLAGRDALMRARATPVVTVTVGVCNTGARAGVEVVPVFSRDPRGGTGGARAVAPYWKRLVGYARLPLEAGQCGSAVVSVSADDLAQYRTDYAGAVGPLAVLPGNYTFSTGPHARADVLTASIVLN